MRDISPNPETHYGWGAADINFRFWWTYPVMLSPHDPKTLYVTSQMVHRTRNEGQSWEVISPDLTRADPKTLEKTPSYLNPSPGEFWGPITREAYGPEWYATIFAFAESPKQAGVLWAGSDDGYVQVSRDNGGSWTKVTPPDLPEFALISIIDPSPHDAGTAYVAATRFKLQDNKPYLYKTSDYGRTWTKIVDGIPAADFTRVIREDPGRKGLLYAGTETGVYVSFDDGGHWQSIRLNLPVVPIHDLLIKDGDLVAATHGRSFWVLDNVALLHQVTPATTTDAVKLFQPRTTVRFGRGAALAGNFASASSIDGVNPPTGVVVPFYLKDKPTGPVTLTITKEGTGPGAGLVRTITFDPEGTPRGSGPQRPVARGGSNTYVWDMRYPAPTVLPDAVFQGRAVGPVAPPGTYTLELSANGLTARTTATIVKDPRLTYTDADLDAQFAFLMTVRDKLTETMTVVKRVRDMRARAEDLVKQAKESRRGKSPEAIAAARQRDERPEQPALHHRGAAGAVSRQGQSGPHRQPDRHRQQTGPAPRVRVDGRRAAHRRLEGLAEAPHRRDLRALGRGRRGGEEGDGRADEADHIDGEEVGLEAPPALRPNGPVPHLRRRRRPRLLPRFSPPVPAFATAGRPSARCLPLLTQTRIAARCRAGRDRRSAKPRRSGA